MKKYNYIILLLTTVLFAACYEDIGNYDYSEKEEITVTGIKGEYTVTAFVDSLNLTPTIVSNVDENAEFDYTWEIYSTIAGSTKEMLAQTKDLKHEVSENAGTWNLLFAATNKKSGLTKYVKSKINVATEYTKGWYAIKDDGVNSDIDQYVVADTVVPTHVANDVFSKINGRKMPGEAQLITFMAQYKSFAAGGARSAYTRTLVALSEEDITLNYINTMEIIRDVDNFTFETPSVKKPMYAGFSARTLSSLLVINAGQLHAIYTTSLNNGIFGAAAARNDAHDDYYLSKYAISIVKSSDKKNLCLFYDEMSSSFVYYNVNSQKLIDVTANAACEMPTKNSGKEMLFMGMQTLSVTGAVAYMKDKDEVAGADRTLVLISNGYANLLLNTEAITSDQKLYDATNITCSQDEQVIYFVHNKNELWSRNLSSSVETLQFQAEADEEITMVRQRKSDTTEKAYFKHNYVIVGVSSSDGTYKSHFFDKTAGDLNEEADFVMEGEGRVKDVIFISPNMSETTFVQGY